MSSQSDTVLRSTCDPIGGLTTAARAAMVLWVGGRAVLAGTMSLGSLLVFLAYPRTMQGAFGRLMRTHGDLKRAEASVERIVDVLDSTDEILETPGEGVAVRLENVTFGYGDDHPVLSGVSIEARAGERGATLSDGQKQRLSIARAFLKDAPIIILDEPTSALDATTEDALVDTPSRLAAGRTTFSIAHRLSTVRRADRVAVLDGGRIVEMGTHGELIAAEGAYQRMHAVQQGPLEVGGGAGR